MDIMTVLRYSVDGATFETMEEAVEYRNRAVLEKFLQEIFGVDYHRSEMSAHDLIKQMARQPEAFIRKLSEIKND